MNNTKVILRDKCKKASIKELQDMLIQKEHDYRRLRFDTMKGHSKMVTYDVKTKGNINNLKKQIAVIKTFLNVKLKGGKR